MTPFYRNVPLLAVAQSLMMSANSLIITRRRYRFEYRQQDHIELLTLLKTLPCHVILSGYPSAVYDNLLEGWNSVERRSRTRAGSAPRSSGDDYEVDRVHWASFAGKNFTDRQRIKRKAATGGRDTRRCPGRSVSPCWRRSWRRRAQ